MSVEDARRQFGLLIGAGAVAAGSACSVNIGEGTCPRSAPKDCPPVASTDAFVDGLRYVARGEGDTFIEILGMQAYAGHVFGCTGTQGLTVWRDEGESAPTLMRQNVGPSLANSSFPRCQHVAIDPGSARAAITNRGDEVQPTPWLWVYDLSEPDDPREIGGWSGQASIEGVRMEGDDIWAAAHRDGLIHFRLIDGRLDWVGDFSDEDSDAWQTARMGEHIVMAEGASGLRVYEVSADLPALVGAVELEGSARDVVVDEERARAYVATAQGLAVVDLSDPLVPLVLAERNVPGSSLALGLGQDELVFVAEWDRIRAYSTHDDRLLETVLSEVVPSGATFARVLSLATDLDSGRVYAGEWEGMHAFAQVAQPRAPDVFATPTALQFGDVSKGDRASAVLVVENQGNADLQLWDVATPGKGWSTNVGCRNLAPGERSALELNYKAPHAREVAGTLNVCTDDPDNPALPVRFSANIDGLAIGDSVPEFSLTDLEGQVWDSDGLRGQVTVLAYFATF